MMDIGTTEDKIEGYINTLKDAVATLNRRIEELQSTLYQIRGRMSQLKMEDQVPLLADRYENQI